MSLAGATALAEGPPKFQPEVVPCVVSALAQMPGLAAERATGVGPGLRSEEQRDSSANGEADDDPRGEDEGGPMVIRLGR
jgi:hypothetical protein